MQGVNNSFHSSPNWTNYAKSQQHNNNNSDRVGFLHFLRPFFTRNFTRLTRHEYNQRAIIFILLLEFLCAGDQHKNIIEGVMNWVAEKHPKAFTALKYKHWPLISRLYRSHQHHHHHHHLLSSMLSHFKMQRNNFNMNINQKIIEIASKRRWRHVVRKAILQLCYNNIKYYNK